MKILAAIDFSDSTEQVIGYLLALAKPLQGSVLLLHVAQPDPDFVGFDAGPQSVRDAAAETYHREHTEIQALADRLRDSGVEAKAILVQGATAETILKEAASFAAELIVVGSHGRGAVKRLLVGSTSEGVLRDAECPVLVVPVRDQS